MLYFVLLQPRPSCVKFNLDDFGNVYELVMNGGYSAEEIAAWNAAQSGGTGGRSAEDSAGWNASEDGSSAGDSWSERSYESYQSQEGTR